MFRLQLLLLHGLCPVPYFSICFILAGPLTHKSNTGHLNTICLLPIDNKMGWRSREEDQWLPWLSVCSLVFTSIYQLPLPPYLHSLPLLSFFCLSKTQEIVVFERKRVNMLGPCTPGINRKSSNIFSAYYYLHGTISSFKVLQNLLPKACREAIIHNHESTDQILMESFDSLGIKKCIDFRYINIEQH